MKTQSCCFSMQNMFCVSIDLEVVVDSFCLSLWPITNTNGVPSKYSDIYDISKNLCTCHFKRDLLIWGMSCVDAGQWFLVVCFYWSSGAAYSILRALKSDLWAHARLLMPFSSFLPDPLAGLPEFPSRTLRYLIPLKGIVHTHTKINWIQFVIYPIVPKQDDQIDQKWEVIT